MAALHTKLHRGDKVSWKSHGGTAHGVVEKTLTGRTRIKEHVVAASPDNPEYLVKSLSGAGKAAHKAGALKKE
jgi:hypothetical protein